MIVKTKRLRIEALKEENWKELLLLDENPQVMRFIHQGGTRDATEVKTYVSRALEYETLTGVGGYFTIWEEATDKFIGWVCLRPETESGLRYELGYRLLPEYWGKGIASEAALAMMRKGFLEWKVPEIFAIAYVENRGSVRVMEKVGLRFDAIQSDREIRFQIDRKAWLLDGNSLTSLGIRNSAKAVIVREGKLLLTVNTDHLEGSYYLLPGGGQEKKETLEEAVKRECEEELGVEIEVVRFAAIREYIGAHHEFAKWDEEFHQVEIMFECRLLEEPKVSYQPQGDLRQTGFAWIPIEDLELVRIYPKALASWLNGTRKKQYLGDVN